jgi:hypothetical protein
MFGGVAWMSALALTGLLCALYLCGGFDIFARATVAAIAVGGLAFFCGLLVLAWRRRFRRKAI